VGPQNPVGRPAETMTELADVRPEFRKTVQEMPRSLPAKQLPEFVIGQPIEHAEGNDGLLAGLRNVIGAPDFKADPFRFRASLVAASRSVDGNRRMIRSRIAPASHFDKTGCHPPRSANKFEDIAIRNERSKEVNTGALTRASRLRQDARQPFSRTEPDGQAVVVPARIPIQNPAIPISPAIRRSAHVQAAQGSVVSFVLLAESF